MKKDGANIDISLRSYYKSISAVDFQCLVKPVTVYCKPNTIIIVFAFAKYTLYWYFKGLLLNLYHCLVVCVSILYKYSCWKNLVFQRFFEPLMCLSVKDSWKKKKKCWHLGYIFLIFFIASKSPVFSVLNVSYSTTSKEKNPFYPDKF